MKFNFKKNYLDCWRYLKDSKVYILVIVGIFFLFSLLGFFITPPEEVSSKLLEMIREILARTEGMSQGNLISFIFLNNLKSSFLGMIFGSFLGIFSLLASLGNGYLLGFVSSISVDVAGTGSLWRLLPHGIFELPAIFISLGMGLRLGTFIFRKNSISYFEKNLKKSLKVFILIIVPLLIVAAIIEGTLIALGN
jgi:stage II sporulation protein M